MSDVAVETAYYFNETVLVVALIAKGVRFPAGKWDRALPPLRTPIPMTCACRPGA